MKVGISEESFIKEFSESLKNGNASFFIGSGISRKAQYVGWKDVLRECAIDIGLDVEQENDLITLAEYYVRDNQRTKITETIKNFFADSKGEIQDIHKIIASLPVNSVWTTNYDTLIERGFASAGITTTVITDDLSYRNIDRTADVKIYKIHGSVKNADKCIIARRDYDEFARTHDIVLSELKGEMCSNSFLFLGYSFSDTDIQHILTRIRLTYDKEHPQRHFSIIEEVKRNPKETDAEFEYRKNKQSHYVSDMQSYGINVLLVESYDRIEQILSTIRNKVFARNVLISGAYESSDAIAESRISPVATKLSTELTKSGYKIYTGYGKNIGADIVNGVYNACSDLGAKSKKFDDNIVIYPFPYKGTNKESKKKIYFEIRSRMASSTKIMIVIAGKNKSRNSAGVYQEYQLAKEQGNLIIPIASTGGSAREIWVELNGQNYYNDNELFQKLGTETAPDEIVNVVMKLINDNGVK